MTRQISQHTGIPVRSVRRDWYGDDKRNADASKALVWRGRPVRRLDQPFPDDIRFQRNGWLVLDPADLRDRGIRLRPAGKAPTPGGPPSGRARKPPRGQGRLDLSSRLAVEQQAMALAKLWCREKQEWAQIDDTSQTQSWDLEATDASGRRRYIEVKGLTGGLGEVEITAGELKAAQRHGRDHVLLVVYGIKLGINHDGDVTAAGGTVKAYDPWSPKGSELTETRYRWRRV